MTEQEWLTCTDPSAMLNFLPGEVSDRKLRLLAAACCRRVWHLIRDEQDRQAVEVVEQFVEHLASHEELATAFGDHTPFSTDPEEIADSYGMRAVAHPVPIPVEVVNELVRLAIGEAIARCTTFVAVETIRRPELRWQCDAIRDVFGNPFSLVVISSAWLRWNDRTISRITDAIYNDRAFDRLPILADALEEAGCTNAEILNHCRQPGEHMRGCWVVDLLLGKA